MNSYLTMYRRQGARIVQVCTVGNDFSRIGYIFWPAQGLLRESARWRTFGILTLVSTVQYLYATWVAAVDRIFSSTLQVSRAIDYRFRPSTTSPLPTHHHPYLLFLLTVQSTRSKIVGGGCLENWEILEREKSQRFTKIQPHSPKSNKFHLNHDTFPQICLNPQNINIFFFKINPKLSSYL